MPLNLVEFAQVNASWLWELEACLAAFRDGQTQQSDVRRQMDAALAGHKRGT